MRRRPMSRPHLSRSRPLRRAGPLFVLDFRLAFRTSADADGAAGAPGLELGGVPLTAMQAITDDAYVALL